MLLQTSKKKIIKIHNLNFNFSENVTSFFSSASQCQKRAHNQRHLSVSFTSSHLSLLFTVYCFLVFTYCFGLIFHLNKLIKMDKFVKATSNNLPRVDIFMVHELIKRDDRFNIAEVAGVKATRYV